MIIKLKPNVSIEKIDSLKKILNDNKFEVFTSYNENMQINLGVVGPEKPKSKPDYLSYYNDIIDECIIPKESYLLSGRAFHPLNTVIDVEGVKIGGDELVVMAGPCAVETREQVLKAAEIVSKLGAKILRGGAFKPRTNPYSFQGLGEEGLKYLREAGDKYGMPVITEVLDTKDVELVAQYADILQIGARNMQNFRLLSACGKVSKAVLIKRGLAATLAELLMSAEYVMASGNNKVLLCERGVRTFEPMTRNTLDISAISVLKRICHLPIVADPSHATGIREQVIPTGRASVAVGADALLVEVHPEPDKAWVDGAQSLDGEMFKELMDEIRIIAPAVKKRPPSIPRSIASKAKNPIFEQVTIMGSGLIGASIALNIKQTETAKKVVVIDLPEIVEDIKLAGIANEVYSLTNYSNVLQNSDLIILSSSINTIIENIKLLSKEKLKDNAIIIDVGSTKSIIVNTAKELLPNHVKFYGTHPMTGSERKGFGAANSSLFYDTIWAVTADSNSEPDSRLITFIEKTGAQVLLISAEEHDLLCALTSHLPQVLSVELMRTFENNIKDRPKAVQLAAGGFRDMTRIASSPYGLWQDIISTNHANLKTMMKQLIDNLTLSYNMLGSNEQNEYLKKEFESAAACRLGIPRIATGLLKPLSTIAVNVIDQPGALSTITTALAQARINIKDLQIVKIREDEDGYLHVAFSSKKDAEEAVNVLRRVGCEAKVID